MFILSISFAFLQRQMLEDYFSDNLELKDTFPIPSVHLPHCMVFYQLLLSGRLLFRMTFPGISSLQGQELMYVFVGVFIFIQI